MKNLYKVTLHRIGAKETKDDLFMVRSITGPGPDIPLYGKVVAAGDRIDHATALALGGVATITTTA